MRPIRVLVVDDSSFARELIADVLATDKDIVLAGEAANGKEALQKVAELKPDLVTMDIEMPVMNGLEAIEKIMALHAVPILVVTTKSDAGTAYAAVSKGALDLVAKPDVSIEAAHEFIAKIKMLAGIRVITHMKGKRLVPEPGGAVKPIFSRAAGERLVAIASSTGGPAALSIILSALPQDFPCPVVIAQHMADGFVGGMVEWLSKGIRMKVKVASEGECLSAGTVYISPSERHMEVGRDRKVVLTERKANDIYRPSCDALLRSAATVYGPDTVGVILTGMGMDGAQGMKSIKEAKGMTLAQDEKSSIVYGMNKVAVDSGCVGMILPIDRIGRELIRIVTG
jgi:two-component system chemotaxis response regulator CheB